MSVAEKSLAAPDQPAEPAAPDELSRRRFLARVCYAAGCACAAAVGVPAAAMFVGPMFADVPRVWRAVGAAAQFAVGETVQVTFETAAPVPWSGQTAQTGAWLRRESDGTFTAFAVNCTHLGCPVRWEAGAELFMCPCHGGAYYADGSVAAGPPPNPLPRYPVRVTDGQVEIETGPLPVTT